MKCLLLLTMDDRPYVRKLGELLPPNFAHKATVLANPSVPEIRLLMEGYDVVFTTCPKVCTVLFNRKFKGEEDNGTGETVSNYQGSLTRLPNSDTEIIVLAGLRRLVSTQTGKFLAKRYISKATQKCNWLDLPKFEYTIVETPEQHRKLLAEAATALFCSVDIETNPRIYCIGFGLIHLVNGKLTIHSYTVPISSMYDYETIKQVLASNAPKILQNGLYDTTHLMCYGLPVRNWLYDTLGMFHSWYSELPRRLDFISSFLLRDAIFWKNESKSSNLQEKLAYNAKDCYITCAVFLAWMAESPDWAKQNYRIKFPAVFPSLQCALEGIAVDPEAKAKIKEVQELRLEDNLNEIRTALGYTTFNPGSPKQVLNMLRILGYKSAMGTGKLDLQVAIKKSPVLAWLCPKILEYRKAKKLLGTYIDTKLYEGRLLYALNPFGTDTGRMASSSSPLYEMKASVFDHYGTQIQNFPPYAKQMLRADRGWKLFEIDKSASESYCTALLSGDEKLWKVLHESPDFHCTNASMFFGIPFELLYDVATSTKLNVPLRNIAKKVNHGANYNMGAAVLIITMGEETMWQSKFLILDGMVKSGLTTADTVFRKLYNIRDITDMANYLLAQFDAAYPTIRGKWQADIIKEISETSMIRSPSGWHRWCFGDPANNKPDLNAYIAHGPQHLSVEKVNSSFVEGWKTLQNPQSLRLKAQVHDSILGQYRDGCEEDVYKLELLMRVPIVHRGKTLIIPNDIDLGKEYWK